MNSNIPKAPKNIEESVDHSSIKFRDAKKQLGSELGVPAPSLGERVKQKVEDIKHDIQKAGERRELSKHTDTSSIKFNKSKNELAKNLGSEEDISKPTLTEKVKDFFAGK